jgi:hypothetical protein
LTEAQRTALATEVRFRLGQLAGKEAIERKEAEDKLASLKLQEKKLLAAHFADQVSEELFAEENTRMRRERIAAERTISQLAVRLDQAEAGLDAALALTDRMDRAYEQADDDARRLFNQSIFAPFKVDREEIPEATPQEPVQGLTSLLPENDKTAAPSSWDGGSKVLRMVELAGTLSNPAATQSLARVHHRVVGSAHLAPRRPERPRQQARPAWPEIHEILSDSSEPLTPSQIHAQLEAARGEPVSFSTTKSALATRFKRDPGLRRLKGGRYRLA